MEGSKLAFPAIKKKTKREKKNKPEKPRRAQGRVPTPPVGQVGWGSLALSWGSSMPLSLSKVTTCKIHYVVGLMLMDR